MNPDETLSFGACMDESNLKGEALFPTKPFEDELEEENKKRIAAGHLPVDITHHIHQLMSITGRRWQFDGNGMIRIFGPGK